MSADQAIGGRDLTEMRRAVEPEVRYANITIIEGIGANQLGIGIVSARIAEIVLRDERAIIPIGVFNPKFGVTLSILGILYRTGVGRILEPAMSDEEMQRITAQSGYAQCRVRRRSTGQRLADENYGHLDVTAHACRHIGSSSQPHRLPLIA
jgi:hypothetical protein